MAAQYQERDRDIIDYQVYSLEDTELVFRGPKIENLQSTPYFVCLGAAQTFGCFCERPYAKILEEKLNLPVLNLGSGGAGPSFYLKHKTLIPYINQAKFAIVQIMSGRSESNRVFENKAGKSRLTRRSDGITLDADTAYRQLLKEKDRKSVKIIVDETRQNWLINYKKLLEEIKIPKILFWFSRREPRYQEKYNRGVYNLFGEFPQLVNFSMVKKLYQYSDEYVECVSTRGRYHLLIDRVTNQPIFAPYGSKQKYYNTYYPSPEMQVDAACALEKVCRRYS